MEPLTQSQHRRRQIIFGVILTLAIPIVNSFLSRWGLPSIPVYVTSPPAITSSSGQVTGSSDVGTDDPFYEDQTNHGRLIPCGNRGFPDAGRDLRPRLQFRIHLRCQRRETRLSPQQKSNSTVPVEAPACTFLKEVI